MGNTMGKKKLEVIPRPGRQIVSDEDILDMLEEVALGTSMTDVCQAKGIKPSTVRSRIYRNANLRDADTRARQLYIINQVQQMNELALNEPDVQRARLLCDNIKWEAARVARSLYGDKVSLDVTSRAAELSDEDLEREVQQLLATGL